jgi:hypothetical protein
MSLPGFTAEASLFVASAERREQPPGMIGARALVPTGQVIPVQIEFSPCSLVPSVLCFDWDPQTGWGTGLCDPFNGECSPCYWDGTYVLSCPQDIR